MGVPRLQDSLGVVDELHRFVLRLLVLAWALRCRGRAAGLWLA